MESGQVRSVYLTMNYYRVGDQGVVVHEIQIDKDGKPLSTSTPAKPDRPDRLLFNQTQFPEIPFVRCERIGPKLYIFTGECYISIAKLADFIDAESSGELVEFHDLPSINVSRPYIFAAHGRLYYLATPETNKLGRPMQVEVYDPCTKYWDRLPPLPQCPSVPYDEAPRTYFGYAVWGTCILFSLGYPGMSMTATIFVPVLYNAESRTWHQVYVEQTLVPLHGCFPWLDKALVVGDTVYALGFKKGIISFSITKSGSEEDGTLCYSLTRPYFLKGLKLISHPNYKPRDRIFRCWSPLGDFEFCLVETTAGSGPKYQTFFITTFRIIHKEGTFSCIQTLYSALQFIGTQGYGHFWLLFCYNPDYEPEEVKLTMKDYIHPRNRLLITSQVAPKPILGFELGGESWTKIKWETIEIKNNPELMVDPKLWDSEPEESMINSRQLKRRKRKGKHSKKKGSEGPKSDSYIGSLVKHQVSTVKSYGRTHLPIACLSILSIGLVYGLFSLPVNR